MRLLLLVTCFCISCKSWGRFWELDSVTPQKSWYTYIGGPALDNAQAIRQSPDGGYLSFSLSQAAFSNLGGKAPLIAYSGASDFLITKLGSDGDFKWYTFFGTGVDDWTQDFVATADGGGLGVGYTTAQVPNINSITPIFTGGAGSYGILGKFAGNGALEWWTYVGGGGLQLSGAAATSDGGFVIIGFSTAGFSNTSCLAPLNAHPGAGNLEDIFIAKLSSSGNTQWCTFLGGTANDYGVNIRQASDGSYFFTAHIDANTGNIAAVSPLAPYQAGQDIAVFKLNSSGGLVWFTYLGSSGADTASALEVTADGGVIVAGKFAANPGTLDSFSYTGAYGGGDDAVLIKLNASGHVSWYKLYGGAGTDTAYGLAIGADGGYIVSGKAGANIASLYGLTPRTAYSASDDILLFRTDASGNVQWYTMYGGAGSDYSVSLAQTLDGGFITGSVAAQNISNIASFSPLNAYTTGNDVLIIKFKSDGSLVAP